jgi:hypothetical protein
MPIPVCVRQRGGVTPRLAAWIAISTMRFPMRDLSTDGHWDIGDIGVANRRSSSGRRKVGRKKRRMRSKIRHRKS